MNPQPSLLDCPAVENPQHPEHPSTESEPIVPLSVNFFFTRICNLSCKFCFHTNSSKFKLPIEETKRGLEMLAGAGMKKLNIAGGEPFMFPQYLGEMIKYCKEDLKLESVSIMHVLRYFLPSNGSKVTESWLRTYGKYVDIFGVSCDSFDEETNVKIGRSEGGYKGHVQDARRISEWCHDKNVLFKLNTVVNKLNVAEDMNTGIEVLAPHRWKVFQCLILDGENSGTQTSIRDARELVVTDDEFSQFVKRHEGHECMVAESNQLMRDSYLMLDEKMRFLNCSTGGKIPGRSVLDVGVHQALQDAGFDQGAFLKRGGVFEWQKPKKLIHSATGDPLDW
ncbi:radical SAM enzyme [Meredithblackwellia eburnea MCA 4105]